LVTAFITAPVADHVTKKMGVSNMEGGRGYAVIALILAGFVGGLIIGLVTTRVIGAVAWSQFWKVEGIALLAANVVLFGIAGACLATVPKPPLLNGRTLDLEVEIHVPTDLAPTAPFSEKNLRMSLYAGPKDNCYVDIDTARTRTEGDELVVRATASLNSAGMDRMFSLTVNDSVSYTLDMPLRPKPREADLAWTEPLPMRLSHITGTSYTYTRVLVRYRVVPAAPEQP
ncbi:MAG TPA: hypothetical protein VHL57_10005, partial [Flavobacteriales bacterium]|nr:hypothetical protein [Flavobacteriales bacterium]